MSASLNRELPLTAKSISGCACCAPACGRGSDTERRQSEQPAGRRPATEYRVAGMTCGHCASNVAGALNALAGVSDVQIALVPGGISRVTVTAAHPLNDVEVRSAVTAAGYELVTP
jgi:copper chaperone